MIYKFKVWVWLPMTTEIHLTALSDKEAVETFNKIGKSRVTYEVINVQNTDKGINYKGESGEKS